MTSAQDKNTLDLTPTIRDRLAEIQAERIAQDLRDYEPETIIACALHEFLKELRSRPASKGGAA